MRTTSFAPFHCLKFSSILFLFITVPLLVFQFLVPASIEATPIYKTKDASGQIQYTSQPPHKNAKPAQLPEIMRGEVKLKTAMVSCKVHGGPDCEAGPDGDGSVICVDGFRDAAERFNFSCSGTKIRVSEVTEPDKQGEFKVLVRNLRSVAAQNPKLLLRIDKETQIELEGPKQIDGYGIGEFIYKPSILALARGVPLSSLKEQVKARPGSERLDVTCSNCS